MRKGIKRVVFDDANNYRSATMLDEIDTKIIAHLISGKENKEIANELKVPLSTIQRRVRKLFEKNTIQSRVEPNYKQLGYGKGSVHLSINNIDALTVAQRLAELQGVISVSIHIGNSDVIGDIIFRDSTEVLDIIAQCKRIEGVSKVIWSEEVYQLPVLTARKFMTSFNKT